MPNAIQPPGAHQSVSGVLSWAWTGGAHTIPLQNPLPTECFRPHLLIHAIEPGSPYFTVSVAASTGVWEDGWVWGWWYQYLPYGAEHYQGLLASNGQPLESHPIHEFTPYLNQASDDIALRPVGPDNPNFRVGDALRPLRNNAPNALWLSHRFDVRESDGYTNRTLAHGRRYREGQIGEALNRKLAAIQMQLLFRRGMGESWEEISADLNDMPIPLLETVPERLSPAQQATVRQRITWLNN